MMTATNGALESGIGKPKCYRLPGLLREARPTNMRGPRRKVQAGSPLGSAARERVGGLDPAFMIGAQWIVHDSPSGDP